MFAIEVSKSVISKCRLLLYRIHAPHRQVGPPQDSLRVLEVLEAESDQVSRHRVSRRRPGAGVAVGELAEGLLARGGKRNTRPCAQQRQARRARLDSPLPTLPATIVLGLGTAVYRTVRTVVWEDGAPTNGVPSTRLISAMFSVFIDKISNRWPGLGSY